MTEGDGHADAVPSALPEGDRRRGGLVHTLVVDGEVFEVFSHDGGTDYDWISGRNEDYGFGSSGRAEDMSPAAHVESIRSFLSMIDPETGYIAED